MTTCEQCGKLIASGTGEVRCRACRTEAAIAAAANVLPPLTDVPVAEDAVDLSSIVQPDPDLCVRCRRHPSIDDSEFCLACHLELVAALGEAADEVFRHPPAPPAPPVASPASLMSDLESKRERTATSHIRVVGGVRIK